MNLRNLFGIALLYLMSTVSSPAEQGVVESRTNSESKVQTLEYIIQARNEEKGLSFQVSNDVQVTEEINIEYKSWFVKIDEHYKSIIDPVNLNTISFFGSRTNRFFGRPNNHDASSNFYTNRIETFEIGKINTYWIYSNDTLTNSKGFPMVLDPMSVYYFLLHRDITNLHNKSVICSDGGEPWLYNFEVKSTDKGYNLKAKTKKRNAAFDCDINDGKIQEIRYKAAGIVPIKMTLRPTSTNQTL